MSALVMDVSDLSVNQLI